MPSFTDNGDGTVTDNVTGLMWEKHDEAGGIHDHDNRFTWAEAFSVKVAMLNASSFAGYDDWRLPNLRELESLPNFGAQFPAAFTEFGSDCSAACTVLDCSCTASDGHWSSTTSLLDPSHAWRVHFSRGYTGDIPKSSAIAVRAVRGGQ